MELRSALPLSSVEDRVKECTGYYHPLEKNTVLNNYIVSQVVKKCIIISFEQRILLKNQHLVITMEYYQ